jgi:hypothetical protein
VAVQPNPTLYLEVPLQRQNWRPYSAILPRHSFPLPPFIRFFSRHRFLSSNMPPQLNAAQHILVNALLKERFETKLIATEASYSVRRPENPSERAAVRNTHPQRINTVGRCSYITNYTENPL